MNSHTARYGGFSAEALLLAAMILAWLAPRACAEHSEAETKAGFMINFAQLSKSLPKLCAFTFWRHQA